MAMQYEVPYGNQCPKYPEIKKASKRLCEACVHNYHAYQTFAWCSDEKQTTRKDILDWKKFKEEDRNYDREVAEKEYRKCAIRIKDILKIYPDFINIEI